MAIYREIFKLKDKNLSLENLLSKVEQSTGLQFDMEIIDRNSAFISCRNLKKVSIEINIEEDGNINIYFPPREKKYLEYSIINVLNKYLTKKVNIPNYAKKKWKDLSFFERLKYR